MFSVISLPYTVPTALRAAGTRAHSQVNQRQSHRTQDNCPISAAIPTVTDGLGPQLACCNQATRSAAGAAAPCMRMQPLGPLQPPARAYVHASCTQLQAHPFHNMCPTASHTHLPPIHVVFGARTMFMSAAAQGARHGSNATNITVHLALYKAGLAAVLISARVPGPPV